MKQRPLIPLLPPFLTGMWLLLNDTLAPGQVILGIMLASLITVAITTLRPLPAWPHRLHVAIGLIWHVVIDIIRSNLAVGKIILGATRRQPQTGFMKIPLDLRDPHGLAMLSIIITATPGTVWSGHDPDNNVLTLHVLDLQDEAGWIHTIKGRYEAPLMEIFE